MNHVTGIPRLQMQMSSLEDQPRKSSSICTLHTPEHNDPPNPE